MRSLVGLKEVSGVVEAVAAEAAEKERVSEEIRWRRVDWKGSERFVEGEEKRERSSGFAISV